MLAAEHRVIRSFEIASLTCNTPRDLYTLPGSEIHRGVYELIGPDKSYFPEIDIAFIDRDQADRQIRLTQRVVAKRLLGGARNFWQVSSFWMDETPFMIAQEAGPEGMAHFELLITDQETLRIANRYMRGFYYPYTSHRLPTIGRLTSYFGTTLDADTSRLSDFILSEPRPIK